MTGLLKAFGFMIWSFGFEVNLFSLDMSMRPHFSVNPKISYSELAQKISRKKIDCLEKSNEFQISNPWKFYNRENLKEISPFMLNSMFLFTFCYTYVCLITIEMIVIMIEIKNKIVFFFLHIMLFRYHENTIILY